MTRPLPGPLSAEVDRVARAERLLVASDFDGTMSAIVDDPAAARTLPETDAAIRALAELPQTVVAVVSGRSLAMLHQLTGLPPAVHLVGSHGMEFDESFAAGLDEADRDRLELLDRQATALAARFAGLQVERKPASIAMHYRHVAPEQRAAAVEAIATGPQLVDGAHVTTGKEVVEVAAVQTSKGYALDRLRAREHVDVVMFVGDDVTDEHAFAVLREGDLGVKVGSGPTAATQRVAGVADVAVLFETLVQLRRDYLSS
ncbi:trehalose-phosphatase [Epidermidibacterium keratini]|uniref:Trehalose 6-phosphate phosphatase n=1 Tax=Epidermidibacterium keratini TaxID=1891644 RepID=A0A7L4YUY3_9ACTN|nr:trehalose-phosphatase [Epidermidibacterium keratini]QHC02147.1 trehalose-phosphatase [Epidermidibacterium keratini]